MLSSFFRAPLASRGVLPGLVAALAGVLIATPAAAQHRHHHHHHHHGRHAHHARHSRHPVAYSSRTATGAVIVEDGATGRVLFASNAEALRHPASLTKVMTLYLLFERLQKGQIALDSVIPISAHAAAQAPTKLGLRPGQVITVDNAIKAIVTRSANDIAVAVAERLAGTESRFAEEMTRKAHELGMTHTSYVNASGLPDARQLTTAADLAVLGRDIRKRFPQYFHYFSLRSFVYEGRRIRNHDHLLGRIPGVDGIKTGFTNASGFNLMTSVRRDGHYLIAVVMGGRTWRSRDNYMTSLIRAYIDKTGPARAPEPEKQHRSMAREPASMESTLRARPAYVTAAEQEKPEIDRRDVTAAIGRRDATDGSTAGRGDRSKGAITPTVMHWVVGPSAVVAYRDSTRFESGAKSRTGARAERRAHDQRRTEDVAVAEKPPVSGWMIQIGATDDVEKARGLLARAKAKRSAALRGARPFTEKVNIGGSTLYRARFAGLEASRAEAACRALKSSGFRCFAIKD